MYSASFYNVLCISIMSHVIPKKYIFKNPITKRVLFLNHIALVMIHYFINFITFKSQLRFTSTTNNTRNTWFNSHSHCFMLWNISLHFLIKDTFLGNKIFEEFIFFIRIRIAQGKIFELNRIKFAQGILTNASTTK